MTKLTADRRRKIEEGFRTGLSANQAVIKFGIDFETAHSIQQDLSEDTKSEAINNRIILRQVFRDHIPAALETLSKINSGEDDDMQSGRKGGLARAGLKLKAAYSILQFAKEFVGDNVIEMLTERPTRNVAGEVVFDYESSLSADGSTTLSAIPRMVNERSLRIVAKDSKESADSETEPRDKI